MNLADQTVLVTGGAGFIGCALASIGADASAQWIAVDSLHPQVHPGGGRPEELPESVDLIVGDASDPLMWDRLLGETRPDVIVHLAAETGTAQSLNEATRHATANVVGTTAMLDAFGRADHVPEHIILSSSRAVYGEGRWRRADGTSFSPGQRSHAQLAEGRWDFDDADPEPSSASGTAPAPTSIYGATKLTQEHVLSAWAGAHDAGLSILRLQNVYGPGQSLTNSYTGIVTLFSRLARRGESIPLYEDGRITRDFVYIDDVADAFLLLLQGGPRRSSGPWDVGSGTPSTIAELATTISEVRGAPEPHVTGQFRDGDVRHAACTIDATVQELGWRPRRDLGQGIRALQDWIDGVEPE